MWQCQSRQAGRQAGIRSPVLMTLIRAVEAQRYSNNNKSIISITIYRGLRALPSLCLSRSVGRSVVGGIAGMDGPRCIFCCVVL